MTGVYSSTIQGLAEKNSQGFQRLFQTPSFGSQGPFIVQQLYLQIHSYTQGRGLPPLCKPAPKWGGCDSSWQPPGVLKTQALQSLSRTGSA